MSIGAWRNFLGLSAYYLCNIVVLSFEYRRQVSIMTLTVKLADQEQTRLDVLMATMQAGTQSDAVRKLINEKFESLQADKTLLERRGGHPKHLLDGSANLSSRAARKAVVAEKIVAKTSRRRSK
jgi:hypothetical protein